MKIDLDHENALDESYLASPKKEEIEMFLNLLGKIKDEKILRKLLSEKGLIPEMFCYPYMMLPLSQKDEERFGRFLVLRNNSIADIYAALLDSENTKLNRDCKKSTLQAIEIFRNFIKTAKSAYPNFDSKSLMDVAFIQKLSYISEHFKDISDYVMSELQKGDKKLICASKKPYFSENGRLHLTENDIRTMKMMADYALIDELVDKDYTSSIGRLIVYK